MDIQVYKKKECVKKIEWHGAEKKTLYHSQHICFNSEVLSTSEPSQTVHSLESISLIVNPKHKTVQLCHI